MIFINILSKLQNMIDTHSGKWNLIINTYIIEYPVLVMNKLE